ncbi:MAG: choice-of-anchor D domain-containing protein [Myxococcaceae bacterium]
MKLTRFSALAFVVFSTVACRCGDVARRVSPLATVNPLALDFGKVKVNSPSPPQSLRVSAGSSSPVAIASITLRDGSAPGGAAAFTVGTVPATVSAFGSAAVEIIFLPTEQQAYEAIATVTTDDPDHLTIEVLLNGEGAIPKLSVTPECTSAQNCKGTAVLSPPSIDFGAEPLMRASPIPQQELPHIRIGNEGDVDLLVTMPNGESALTIQGRDAAAFKIQGNTQLTDTSDDGKPALRIAGGSGPIVYIRFVPTSNAQTVYDQASLVIRSDDPELPEVTVALRGTKTDNLPPTICANVIRAVSGTDSIDYDTPADWAPLLMPPAGGYDFSATRSIAPSRGDRVSTVFFSAESSTNTSSCSYDPERGRTGMTYVWSIVSAPAGAPVVSLTGATSAKPSLTLPKTVKPLVGDYVVRLTVTDMMGAASSVDLKFSALLREDLVVQLAWPGTAQTDLDLHLVRPSATGPFSYFTEPGGTLADGGSADTKTAGDINGLIQSKRAGTFNFDWGGAASLDDPRLNVDDQGGGLLVEDISLNFPENDRACAATECRYKVMVHYFKDARTPGSPATCTLSGCADGEACNCAQVADAGMRCVADTAPPSGAATGNGKCYLAPAPTVRIFVRANPVPAAVVPLETLMPPDQVFLGAPCQLLHVADVVWPPRATPDAGVRIEVQGADANGRITNPQLSRYGQRITGSLECTGNTTVAGGVTWYQNAVP